MLRSDKATRLGLQNIPEPHHLEAMKHLAKQIDKVGALFDGKPIIVTSGYRSRAVNEAVKGSKRSQHCRGEAIDFEIEGVDNLAACRTIAASAVEFDQLILEFHTPGDPHSGWVHFSYKLTDNRKQVLTATLKNKKTTYQSGLPNGTIL